ncbi:hypothetical protein LJR042_003511 [Microbacterium maritypicum]|uniref:hypothetical protein n=1 Tax=Microbacterium maritypicum TaxID=33918 RepID=UPI003ECFC1B6
MVALRWASFLLAAECLVCLFIAERGIGSAILAALFFVLFLLFCWTLRSRSTTTRKASS